MLGPSSGSAAAAELAVPYSSWLQWVGSPSRPLPLSKLLQHLLGRRRPLLASFASGHRALSSNTMAGAKLQIEAHGHLSPEENEGGSQCCTTTASRHDALRRGQLRRFLRLECETSAACEYSPMSPCSNATKHVGGTKCRRGGHRDSVPLPVGDNRLSAHVQLYADSDFCLMPEGDTPTRRAIFDALSALCIPVFFASCLEPTLVFEQMYSHFLTPLPPARMGTRNLGSGPERDRCARGARQGDAFTREHRCASAESCPSSDRKTRAEVALHHRPRRGRKPHYQAGATARSLCAHAERTRTSWEAWPPATVDYPPCPAPPLLYRCPPFWMKWCLLSKQPFSRME